MRTFDAALRARSFWAAVIVPPMIYFGLVQGCAIAAGGGEMPLNRLVALVALAYTLPLAALGWILCSVAAYSVEPGRLIEHRVVRDRTFDLRLLVATPRLEGDVIALPLRKRTLRLRVREPAGCLAVLLAAQAGGASNSG